MEDKLIKFDLASIKPDHDYECKFKDGHTEHWYGGDLLDASDSQGAIFIFQITEVKDIGKPSKEELSQRKKRQKEFSDSLDDAVKYAIRRTDEIEEKAGLNVDELIKLTDAEIKARFEKERKRFPDYISELNFHEAFVFHQKHPNK